MKIGSYTFESSSYFSISLTSESICYVSLNCFLVLQLVDFSAISSAYEAKESDNRLKFMDVKDSYGSIGPAYFLIFVCTNLQMDHHKQLGCEKIFTSAQVAFQNFRNDEIQERN